MVHHVMTTMPQTVEELDCSFLNTPTVGIIRMVVFETVDGAKSVKDIFEGTPRQVLSRQLELLGVYDDLRIRKK